MRPAVAVVLALTVTLVAARSAAGGDGKLCRNAIAAEERAEHIPRGLLAAVAMAESGRWDAVQNSADPWPWTVTAEGKGRFYPAKRDALAAVGALQARGVRNIDVGCMQINLYHHPDAFSDLAEAFDPAANTAYGARYLRALFEETRSWQQAVGRYHSATPAFSRQYRTKVMGHWQAERRSAQLAGQRSARTGAVTQLGVRTLAGRRIDFAPAPPVRTVQRRDARAMLAFAAKRRAQLRAWRQRRIRY